MADDGGFFGPNREYYWWMYGLYRAGRNLERLGYWAFVRDMKRIKAMKRPVRREK